MSEAFISGFLLSWGLIIPLGVQNMFIFNQGVTQQRWVHSLPSVFTAFFCDALLIVLAISGISTIAVSMPGTMKVIYLIGLVFLIYMGWVTWHSKAMQADTIKPFSFRRQIVFGISASLLNPHAIMDSIGVIGTNSVNFMGADKYIYTFSCILVSFSWFAGLSLAGHFLKKTEAMHSIMPWLNKISAIIILAVAVYIGMQLFD